ncbi:MAG: hypothetical protein HYV32_05525 [Candidatus Kerfeldbacteria bacterium]|nr:hypothetical protein [Candidatus Kerfeldbacteria bacterium]
MRISPEQFTKKKLITVAILILFGAVGRYLLKDIPNIETITVVSLLAGSLLGGVWTLVVGLAVVATTDMLIGNTSILLYTWSAWTAMGVFGWVLRKREKKPFRHALALTGMGILGNVFFYLLTNFGVWHIGGLYPHTLNGLAQSYIMGLPFLKYQFISTLIIVPSVSIVALTVWNALPVFLADRRQAAILRAQAIVTKE